LLVVDPIGMPLLRNAHGQRHGCSVNDLLSNLESLEAAPIAALD
jgi:hypothetical protein